MDRIKKFGFWLPHKPLRPLPSVLGSWSGGSSGGGGGPTATVRNVAVGISMDGSNLTLPTRQSGDTLVAFVAIPGDFQISATSGWTKRIDQIDVFNASRLAVYTRQSNGTDNQPMAANPMNGCTFAIYSISNVASGYDISGSATNNTTTITAPSVVATAGGILLNFYMRCSSSGNISTINGGQSGATVQQDWNVVRSRSAYSSISAAGATGTRTATQDDAVPWNAASVMVK